MSRSSKLQEAIVTPSTYTPPAETTDVALDNLPLLNGSLRERLVNRIMKDEDMPRELAERVLDQTVGYLRLAAFQPDGHFSPSALVDIGWHTFILYTREYRVFCGELTGGGFIHHEPTDDPEVPNLSTGPQQTMAAMQMAGISVDEPLWACLHEGDCSNCNGGQGCQCGSCNY